jgi:FixJ family two-component response regulator
MRTGRLTHRQLEVLELLAKGLTNPEIGRVLDIRVGTVKAHVSAIIRGEEDSLYSQTAGRIGNKSCEVARSDYAEFR